MRDTAAICLDLSARINPILAGCGPDIQSAVLCDLVSLWLAGLPKARREELFSFWISAVRNMVAPSIGEMFGNAPPAGWEP